MSNFKNYHDYVGIKPDKFYKATLFQGEMMMVGLNCFKPGQIQAIHDHADQDKVYMVLEGTAHFTVGDEAREAEAGEIIWAAAGIPHGVENRGNTQVVLLVCIAPPPH